MEYIAFNSSFAGTCSITCISVFHNFMMISKNIKIAFGVFLLLEIIKMCTACLLDIYSAVRASDKVLFLQRWSPSQSLSSISSEVVKLHLGWWNVILAEDCGSTESSI